MHVCMQPVEPGTTPRFTVREDRFAKTTPSLASYYENGEVEEWIQSVAGVLDQGWNDQCVRRPSLAQPFPLHLTELNKHNNYNLSRTQSRIAEARAPLRVPDRVQHLLRLRALPSRRAVLRTLARPRRELFPLPPS